MPCPTKIGPHSDPNENTETGFGLTKQVRTTVMIGVAIKRLGVGIYLSWLQKIAKIFNQR